MDHRFRLVALAVLATIANAANAGYANLAPPPGWSGGTPAAPAATYAKAANEAWLTSTVRTNAALNVGGRSVVVPAAMRLSANAGQVMAGRVGAAVLTGGVAVIGGTVITAAALLAIPVVITWYSQQSSYKWNEQQNTWMRITEENKCDDFTPQEAAQCSYPGSTLVTTITQNTCYRHLTYPGAGIIRYCADKGFKKETQQKPAPWPEPLPFLEPLPVGDPLLNEPKLPWPWPVQPPVINPGPDGQPQPLFVPTGNPIANPNYNPQQAPSPTNQPYLQPGVRVVPSPTVAEPWRVDVQPVNRPVESPNPAPEPNPNPTPNPNPNPHPTPEPDPGNDQPKPEEQQSLCEKHPDVVACAKTGAIEAVAVPNENKPLSINKDTGYGPESGTCPQPKIATVMGKQLSFKYDLLCDFSEYIKPIVIAFAWLSAALTFFGLGRKDA